MSKPDIKRSLSTGTKVKNIFDKSLEDIFPSPHTTSNNNNNTNNNLKPLIEEEEEINIDNFNKITVEAKEFKLFTIDHDDGTYSLRWSPDGQLLAIGCNDGNVRVLSRQGKVLYRLRTVGNMPCTSLRWRPGQDNILITGSCSGEIKHWHVQSQKTIYSIKEDDNQIFALDIRNDGKFFATGGMDRKIRVYDEETKKIYCTMERGYMAKKPGHSNRIFAVKFKPDDKNVLLSGSWDNTVLFWDIRTKGSFRSIYGPHIAGQSLDIQNDVILTGSWRSEETIQSWEFQSGKLLNTINWKGAPMVYTSSFSPDRENIVIAGGTGSNCAKLIDVKTGAKSTSIFLQEKKGIYCADFDPTGSLLALGGDGDVISIFSLKSTQQDMI